MLKHKGTLFFKTKRLFLRPFKKEDAVYIYNNWAKDKTVVKFLKFDAHTCLSDTEQYLEEILSHSCDLNYYNWAIELKGETIGSIMLCDVNERNSSGKIFVVLGSSYWNKGYATEAFQEVVKFLLVRVGFRRLSSSYVLENEYAGKLLSGCGFKYEGVSNKSFVDTDGESHNVCHYAILKEDFDRERQIKASQESNQVK